MTEGKIEIPPPIGLLETDSYSAKANRVTSATSVTTTFEYTITHADGSQVIQIVQDTNGDREVVETKELPATAASKAAKIDIPKPIASARRPRSALCGCHQANRAGASRSLGVVSSAAEPTTAAPSIALSGFWIVLTQALLIAVARVASLAHSLA